jgi:hypothetical protein
VKDGRQHTPFNMHTEKIPNSSCFLFLPLVDTTTKTWWHAQTPHPRITFDFWKVFYSIILINGELTRDVMNCKY